MKALGDKIKSIYAYIRLWLYLVYKLAEYKLIYIDVITKLIIRGCKLVDQALKCENEVRIIQHRQWLKVYLDQIQLFLKLLNP